MHSSSSGKSLLYSTGISLEVGTKLSALIILYIHHLKGIFCPSHHKIYSFPAWPHPSILYIILYSLWVQLVTLSKYIHVTFCFEVFIETNLMVKSEFNLVFWFESYNIFCYEKKWAHRCHLSPLIVVASASAKSLRYCAIFSGQERIQD
jgi:hypothetical protein